MQIYSISSLVVQHASIFICSVSNYFNIVLFFSSREQSTCSLRMYHVYVKLKLCDDISSNFHLWRKQFWEQALLIFKKKYFMKLYFAKECENVDQCLPFSSASIWSFVNEVRFLWSFRFSLRRSWESSSADELWSEFPSDVPSLFTSTNNAHNTLNIRTNTNR